MPRLVVLVPGPPPYHAPSSAPPLHRAPPVNASPRHAPDLRLAMPRTSASPHRGPLLLALLLTPATVAADAVPHRRVRRHAVLRRGAWE
jgi:hypothetical protein